MNDFNTKTQLEMVNVFDTEMKKWTQLNYLKKKIENKTKIKIERISCTKQLEGLEEVIKGFFIIDNEPKFFAFGAWKNKGLLNRSTNELIGKINDMKEKQNSIK